MKKMRGVVDPISLGFILSAVIFGIGVTTPTGDKIATGKIATSVESTQAVSAQHAVSPKAKQGGLTIYDD